MSPRSRLAQRCFLWASGLHLPAASAQPCLLTGKSCSSLLLMACDPKRASRPRKTSSPRLTNAEPLSLPVLPNLPHTPKQRQCPLQATRATWPTSQPDGSARPSLGIECLCSPRGQGSAAHVTVTCWHCTQVPSIRVALAEAQLPRVPTVNLHVKRFERKHCLAYAWPRSPSRGERPEGLGSKASLHRARTPPGPMYRPSGRAALTASPMPTPRCLHPGPLPGQRL